MEEDDAERFIGLVKTAMTRRLFVRGLINLHRETMFYRKDPSGWHYGVSKQEVKIFAMCALKNDQGVISLLELMYSYRIKETPRDAYSALREQNLGFGFYAFTEKELPLPNPSVFCPGFGHGETPPHPDWTGKKEVMVCFRTSEGVNRVIEASHPLFLQHLSRMHALLLEHISQERYVLLKKKYVRKEPETNRKNLDLLLTAEGRLIGVIDQQNKAWQRVIGVPIPSLA